MRDRIPYSYATLRYVHDVVTGEFVNVGVAVFSQEAGFFKLMCRQTIGRIADCFPNLGNVRFKNLLRGVHERAAAVRALYESTLVLEDRPYSLKEHLNAIIPRDDSSLVWSDVSIGFSKDLNQTVQALYERYVAKYDREQVRGRSDEDVVRSFKRTLQDRKVLRAFTEKTIQGQSDKVKFDLAWKNGVWHCIEAISFDLGREESIRDKAHKWAGQIVGVSDAIADCKLYFVVGKPKPEFNEAFERAIGILDNLRVSKEIYTEDESVELADKLAAEVRLHHDRFNLA